GPRRRLGTEKLADFDAADPGHLPVEDDRVGGLRARRVLEHRRGVREELRLADGEERPSDELGFEGAVVDNPDLRRSDHDFVGGGAHLSNPRAQAPRRGSSWSALDDPSIRRTGPATSKQKNPAVLLYKSWARPRNEMTTTQAARMTTFT